MNWESIRVIFIFITLAVIIWLITFSAASPIKAFMDTPLTSATLGDIVIIFWWGFIALVLTRN